MPFKKFLKCFERKEPKWEPLCYGAPAPGTTQYNWPEQVLFQDKKQQHQAMLLSAGK